MTRQCVGCPTLFEVHPRERSPRRWCSRACKRWHDQRPGEVRPLARTCAHCQASIAHLGMASHYCGRRCRELASADRKRIYPQSALCVWCGTLYDQQRAIHKACSRGCMRALYRFENPEKYPSWDESKKAAAQRRRARKAGVDSERVVAAKVYERDAWVCQLCARAVDATLAWPHPHSASLDHVVPLSKGGSHTETNTQLAHLRCNMEKRDTLPATA